MDLGMVFGWDIALYLVSAIGSSGSPPNQQMRIVYQDAWTDISHPLSKSGAYSQV